MLITYKHLKTRLLHVPVQMYQLKREKSACSNPATVEKLSLNGSSVCSNFVVGVD